MRSSNMQVPLQITMRNIEHSEAVEERVSEKANKLNQFSEQLISCSVVVEQNGAHRNNGVLYNVRIHVTMPRKKELIANHNERENLYMAIRDAFDDMKRQVEDANRISQGDIKHHSTLLHGEIARLFEDGEFGFITDSTGDEYYFNADNLVNHSFEYLRVGMPVQFIEKMGDEGPKACRVSIRKEPVKEAM
jgi:ribosomal subunit interface protein